MKKDPFVFISHIIESIELIEEYSKGITQERFLKDSFLQDAVIRRLEIIGEAVKCLPQSFKEKYSKLPWKNPINYKEPFVCI